MNLDQYKTLLMRGNIETPQINQILKFRAAPVPTHLPIRAKFGMRQEI